MALKKRPIRAKAKPAGKPSTGKLKPRKASGKSSGGGQGFYTGSAGFAKATQVREQQQHEYEKKKDTPFRFRIKPGESAELVMLDTKPFFVREHTWKTGPNRYTTEVCIADTGENCPLCSFLGKEGSFTLMCTAIDKRPYKTREGKLIKMSKKLVPAKAKNIPKFERLYDKYKGSIRGRILTFIRDGDKEAAIGETIEDTNKFLPEIKLKKLGEKAQCADYEKIFELPSAAELRARHNLDAPIGSEEFSGGGSTEVDDELPW